MSGSAPMWVLEQNLILQAGAGTGKTHALVTLALHILAGATARRAPVAPARLTALTFTEKAGAEMRERLQGRLARLAEGTPLPDAEPELAASLEYLGLPAPKAELWRRLRRDLSLASVGTFHAFCAAQLRRLAAPAGIDPGFEVLDDDDARAIFEEASEDHVLSALAAKDPQVRLLVDEFQLTTDRGNGVVGLARGVLQRLAEDGQLPAELDDGRFSDLRAAALFEHARLGLIRAVDGLERLEPRHRLKIASAISALRDAAATLTVANSDAVIERLTDIRGSFRKPPRAAGLPVDAFNRALAEVRTGAAGLLTAPLGRAFVALVSAIDARYAAAKRERRALDFADLQRLFRDLLRRDPETRRLVKSRIEGLLVDEFQDTSRLQLDVVAMLAETRGLEADLYAVESISKTVRYEPGIVCIVGDRKQSIYEFRGADVAVFTQAQEALQTPALNVRPARLEFLQKSWRSRPRLVELTNALFTRAMPSLAEPFEVAFTPADALTATLDEDAATGPLAELIEAVGQDVAEQRSDEARRVAARIDELVHAETDPLLVRSRADGESAWRPVEGRDIALLFRRMTNLNVYRDALAERKIAHVVVGGSGFYGTREVLDAWALLRAIDDPEDPVASTALLRSPWCTLRDDTLTRLAMGAEGAAHFEGITIGRLASTPPRLEDPAEQQRLDALLQFVGPMQRELDRLGAEATLALALRELDYLAVVSVLPEADAIAANLEKLRRILARLESRATTPRGVIRTFTESIRERPREPEAASAEESDPRSVRLMTIHQAKGLEFPVVILVDCGATDTRDASPIVYDRDLGLALAVRSSHDKVMAGPRMIEIRDRLRARSQAEMLRLLYVASTRARDYFIASGARRKGSWFELLEGFVPEHVVRRTVDPSASVLHATSVVPASDETIRETPAESNRELLGSASAGASQTPPSAVGRLPITRIVSTVTRLRDFGECPERYRLRHEAGLQEPRPERRTRQLDESELGAIAHRLLELSDFEPMDQPSLDSLLSGEGLDPGRPELTLVRSKVEAFLSSELARSIRALPARQRLREVPFQLAVGLGPGQRLDLKGQIDVLTLTADGARVLDYKLSSPTTDGVRRHLFQLSTYALAAREIIRGADLPISVAIIPLREPTAPVQWTEVLPLTLSVQSHKLIQLGRGLVESLATNTWARVPPSKCAELGCGFIRRCFPDRSVKNTEPGAGLSMAG